MATKQFKAESKRLLDLMINSIYTHKEIFLRELISNASDAIDKLYFRSLTDDTVQVKKKDLGIRLSLDKNARTLTVSDNGIGMTKDELEQNLGTIAKSGSLDFKQNTQANSKVDIIGQFGVGFYSAFMVAKKVTVISRAHGEAGAWKWESRGAEGYTITPCEKDACGTDVILVIKDDEGEEHYSEFLDDWRLAGLVKKYSDYIRWPIRMLREKSRPIEGTDQDENGNYKAPEYESYTEDETLNSMVPLWKRDKKKVTDEEYADFYKQKFGDWAAPAKVIQSKTEGTATYNALLFIPSRAPYNYYSKEYEKGLQLYASGVLIMDKCADLLPDCFSFVKGLVDSQDLSLNISREMLQHDRQLKLIATRLEKKISSELSSMLNNDREKYEEFFQNFGLQLKYGMYDNYGAKKDELKDLVLFASSAEKKMTTLQEYVSRMKPEQKYIYYGCGETVERILSLPQAEALQDKGFEMLCLTDNVDEFALRMLGKYDEKEFRNISADDLGLETAEEQEKTKELAQENQEMLTFMKESLGDKVADVRVSGKLKSHPVCITTDGMISTEMEKVLNSMPAREKIKAQRVLEVNGEHPIFQRLRDLYESDKDRLKLYAEILYDQALLIEGISLEDPADFSQKLCQIL